MYIPCTFKKINPSTTPFLPVLSDSSYRVSFSTFKYKARKNTKNWRKVAAKPSWILPAISLIHKFPVSRARLLFYRLLRGTGDEFGYTLALYIRIEYVCVKMSSLRWGITAYDFTSVWDQIKLFLPSQSSV